MLTHALQSAGGLLDGFMWSLLAAALTGVLCTPLLVAGTPLGAAGVAVSTAAVQLAALAGLIWRWRRAGHPLASITSLQDWRPSAAIARRMLRIGLPAALQMLSMAIA